MTKKNPIEKKKAEDLYLWKGFIHGEPDAFLRLYDQYVDTLFSFGQNFTKDEDLIKDCIHNLFIDLYKYRERLTETVHIRFYLYSSLKRKIIKEQKKKNSVRPFDPSFLPFIEKRESPAAEYTIIQKEEENNQHQLLLKALQSLSSYQREVLFLRFNQELSYPEIANLFQISIESVRTLVYRSLKILRELLTNQTKTSQFLFFLFRYSYNIAFRPNDL